MEDILNILEKITKIRATGTFAGYEPEGRHKNAIYFATDKDEIYFNGKCYSGSSKNEDTMPEVVSELSRIIGLQKKMNRITGTTKYDITDTNFEYYVKNVGMVNTIIVVKNKTFELNLNKNIITSFSETFRERTFIDVLDLSQVNTSQLVNVKYMFSWCNINFLNICNFNLNNLDELNITNMFYRSVIKHIKCNQYFKDWCYNYKDDIMLPSSMLEGGETIWEIID